MSWIDQAAAGLERMDAVVAGGARYLASECSQSGRISTELLDRYQESAYLLAFLASEAAAGRALLSYAGHGELETALSRVALADLVRSARHRLDGHAAAIDVEDDLRGRELDSVVTSGLDADAVESVVNQLQTVGHFPTHLPEDVSLLAGTFRQFAAEQVIPRAEEVHRRDLDVPEEVIEGMAAMGAFGMSVPPQYGGFRESTDRGALAMVVATDELSRGSLMAGSLLTRPEILVTAILAGGTEEQKERWLPLIASGEKMVCVSVTEPDHGSDVAGIRTMARRVGDHFLLRGSKIWATLAGRAELLAVLARTNPDASLGARGLSMFVIEKPQFSGREFIVEQPGGGRLMGRAIDTLGYRGLHSFELTFDDLAVPEDALIGGDSGLDRGFYLQLEAFAPGRLQTAARALGVMQAAFDEALSYAGARKVFERPLIDFPLIKGALVRMAARIQANRGFTYEVASLLQGDGGQVEAAMAKALASRAAEEITRDAMQIHGGYGYAEEYPVSRMFVDARVLSIFEGTEEVLAVRVIARNLIERASG